MKVYENEYIIIKVEKEGNICFEAWKPATKTMTKKEWKDARIQLMNIVLEYECECLLSSATNLHTIITPDLQEWLAQNISKKVGHLIKKIAITLPEELFSEASVKQLMKEKETAKMETQYFNTEENARKWLLGK